MEADENTAAPSESQASTRPHGVAAAGIAETVEGPLRTRKQRCAVVRAEFEGFAAVITKRGVAHGVVEIAGEFARGLVIQRVLIEAISQLSADDTVFGQYQGGLVHGTEVIGYREEPKVRPDSQVATFAALKLDIANWRWHGVPFYLRTGKRLRKRITEIVVTFRCPPVMLFQPFDTCQVHSNVLVITIQPDEGFDLCFEVKVPGQDILWAYSSYSKIEAKSVSMAL